MWQVPRPRFVYVIVFFQKIVLISFVGRYLALVTAGPESERLKSTHRKYDNVLSEMALSAATASPKGEESDGRPLTLDECKEKVRGESGGISVATQDDPRSRALVMVRGCASGVNEMSPSHAAGIAGKVSHAGRLVAWSVGLWSRPLRIAWSAAFSR